MENEERQALLNNILSNLTSINHRTAKMDYPTFKNEEAVREEIYSEMQEIGQTAADILRADDSPLDLRNDLELLQQMTGATHNQHTEMNHQTTWNVIQNDLPAIGERLEQSEAYHGKEIG